MQSEYLRNTNLKIVLSSHPDDNLLTKYLENPSTSALNVHEFHPSCLYVCRKKGGRRLYDKEPVPNSQMFQVELHIVNRVVKIINKKSVSDIGRSVPDEDELFELGDDNMLHFGDNDKTLNVVILRCHDDKRSSNNDDHLTVSDVINSRLPDVDQTTKNAIAKCFEKECRENKFKLRIKVDIYDLESNELLETEISCKIVNPDSKEVGALKIADVIPNGSCSEGGRKVVIISEFPMSKAAPVLQLWQNGQQIPEQTEKQLLVQPTEYKMIQNTIIFITPRQPNITDIVNNDYQFKLVAFRESDKVTSDPFDFKYVGHDVHMTINSMELNADMAPVQLQCTHCLDSVNSILPLKEKPKPNHKRKLLSQDQINKIRRSEDLRAEYSYSVLGQTDGGSIETLSQISSSPGLTDSQHSPSPGIVESQQSLSPELNFSPEMREELGDIVPADVLRENGIEPDGVSSSAAIRRQGLATADGPRDDPLQPADLTDIDLTVLLTAVWWKMIQKLDYLPHAFIFTILAFLLYPW